MSFNLFSIFCLLFLAFFVVLSSLFTIVLVIYKEGQNKCALKQPFFGTQNFVAFFSFLAFLIV